MRPAPRVSSAADAPVTIEEYVASHPEDRVAAAYLKIREAEAAYWRGRIAEGASSGQIEQEVGAAAATVLDWKRTLGEPGVVRRWRALAGPVPASPWAPPRSRRRRCTPSSRPTACGGCTWTATRGRVAVRSA